jgi:predicted CXXCH cytochrome family protein
MRRITLLIVVPFLVFLGTRRPAADTPRVLDPAGWGGDHVGQAVPEFVAGDECLFCHRNDIGPRWERNHHNRAMRPASPSSPEMTALRSPSAPKVVAGEVAWLLGERHRVRFLKRSEEFGKVELLTTSWRPPGPGREAALIDTLDPHWDRTTFGASCAGCHATGVDSGRRAFATSSLDCYVCHGRVNLEHSKDTSLVHFAKKRHDPARVVISVCAQCHARGGQSKSTGLPYPNTFVAGDNVFRDFQVDLSDESIRRHDPADAHVLASLRDGVVRGEESVTCMTCHDVHQDSSRKHQRVATSSDLCLVCHNPTGPKRARPPREHHSQTCRY